MRRIASVGTLLIALGLIACAPTAPPPAAKPTAVAAAPAPSPAAAKPAAAAKPGQPGWEGTDLPITAAPGASADDSEDERQGDEKSGRRTRLSSDLATPRTIPTVAPPPPVAGLSQETFVEGLILPVAFEFTPDGKQMFINELYGKVRLVSNGQLQPDPVVVLPTTQGLEQGALGLALDPNFAQNRWFYVLYSQTVEGKNEPRRNRIVRFTEREGKGTDETVIFENLPIGKPSPENVNGDHNGGRIAFGPDGKLYVAMGDTARRTEARKPKSLYGKMLRLNADGTTPSDNPDPDEPIWALGLRSPFGIDFQPGSGLPWVSDNGPQGHDEINRIVKAANYGWPEVAGKASNGDPKLTDPVWESGTERFGPTGVAFYRGTAVPQWQNDLFFCDWNTGTLWRLNLQPPNYDTSGGKSVVAQPCRLYVRNGPDGALYFSDHHAIYRLGPPK